MRRNLKILPLLKALLLATALGYLALFLFVALRRLAYPYELEWLEGGVLDHVARLRAGRPLYVAPSLEFIPFIYTPLYFYACALLAQLLGTSFLTLRLVSLLASVGCIGLVGALVWRETRARLPAALAAGLYAACYPLSGFWYDLGRVDPLFMLFVLAGIYMLREVHGAKGQALGGVVFALAFLTKQTALLIAAPLVVYGVFRLPWRRKFIFPLTLAVLAGLGALVLDRASGGWFRYYIFKLPGLHPLDRSFLADFWIHDLGEVLPVALGLNLLVHVRLRQASRWSDSDFFLALAAGMIGASWFARLHSLGFSNVLMPAFAALSIGFGLMIADHLPSTKEVQETTDKKPRTTNNTQQTALMLSLALIQFLMLLYNPFPQIPTRQDQASGDAFVRYVRALSGDVFIPMHGRLGPLAGKPAHAHAMAILDILRSHDAAARIKLEKELHAAYASHRFAAIVIDGDWYNAEIEQFYDPLETGVYRDSSSFLPVIGMRVRPEFFYVPKNPSP